MIGIDSASEGLALAAKHGPQTSADGVDWLLSPAEVPGIMFETTSAYAHMPNAARHRETGIRCHRPHAGGARPVHHSRGQSGRAHRRTRRQHDHPQWAGGDLDGAYRVSDRRGAVRRDRGGGGVAISRCGDTRQHRRVHSHRGSRGRGARWRRTRQGDRHSPTRQRRPRSCARRSSARSHTIATTRPWRPARSSARCNATSRGIAFSGPRVMLIAERNHGAHRTKRRPVGGEAVVLQPGRRPSLTIPRERGADSWACCRWDTSG